LWNKLKSQNQISKKNTEDAAKVKNYSFIGSKLNTNFHAVDNQDKISAEENVNFFFFNFF